jgi:hypothetical protein
MLSRMDYRVERFASKTELWQLVTFVWTGCFNNSKRTGKLYLCVNDDVDLVMTPQKAREMAQALIQQAEYVEYQTGTHKRTRHKVREMVEALLLHVEFLDPEFLEHYAGTRRRQQGKKA